MIISGTSDSEKKMMQSSRYNIPNDTKNELISSCDQSILKNCPCNQPDYRDRIFSNVIVILFSII